MRGLVAGLLVAVPLVFDPRRGHEGGRPKYLALVLGAAALSALLAALVATGRRPWAGNWLTAPVIILVLCTAASTLVSAHRETAVFGFPGLRHGLITTMSLGVVFFATVATVLPGDARRLLEVLWFGAGGGVLLFGLGQLQDRILSPDQGWDWARPGISPWTIGSTLGNANHLSSFLAMLVPIGLVLAATAGPRQRRVIVAMIAVAVVELGITTSRGGVLAEAAALVMLALLFRRDLRPHRAAVLRLAGAAAVLVLVVVAVFGAAGITKGRPGAFARTGTGTTLDLRLEVWQSAWEMAGDDPVLGVGPDVFSVRFPAYATERFMVLYGPFTVANGAHNLLFDTLADLGILGLVALVSLLAIAARGIGRGLRALAAVDRERRLLAAGTAAALVAFLVQAMFNTDEVALSLCFWTLLGLAVVLCPAHRLDRLQAERGR